MTELLLEFRASLGDPHSPACEAGGPTLAVLLPGAPLFGQDHYLTSQAPRLK